MKEGRRKKEKWRKEEMRVKKNVEKEGKKGKGERYREKVKFKLVVALLVTSSDNTAATGKEGAARQTFH